MTHLDIINRALVSGGMNPRTSFEDTNDSEISSVRAFYDSCWRDVLASHPWSDLLAEETMTGTEDGLWYRYDIPDACMRVVSVENSIGAVDYKKRGRSLYTKYDEIQLVYVTSNEILPIDYGFLDQELQADIPPTVDEVVSLRLASQIVFRLSQNQNVQTQLHNRYMVALQNAKMHDMRGTGGLEPWSGVDYGDFL